jgi:uroporphyrinogen-III synthase
MRPHAISGRRILLTRAADDAERWAERLRELGASPSVLPCIECETLDDQATSQALRAALDGAAWLVLTSARGAEATFRLLRGSTPAGVSIAAVGPSTAKAAEPLGVVSLVSSEGTSAGLARALLGRLRTAGTLPVGRVVVAGAEGGRADAEAVLAAAGVEVVRVNVYRTVPAPPATPRRDLAAERIDAVWLASPSAVAGLLNTAELPRDARVITIGPTTSSAATLAGLRVAAEAREPTLEGMLEATS